LYNQDCSLILAGFAINWPARDRILKEEFHPPFSIGEKLADFKFAERNIKEICGFAI
jgi:hypothetical protein